MKITFLKESDLNALNHPSSQAQKNVARGIR
jgi:hypothetical protein